MKWADKEATSAVRANADTPGDARTAVEFGAEGIGLCRTEHMFFGPRRIDAVREMILAETPDQRARALDKIIPIQREDFVGFCARWRASGHDPAARSATTRVPA